MTGATDAAEALADRLEATIDWAALHAHASAAPVVRFLMLAAESSFIASIEQHHTAALNELLDHAAGQAGAVGPEVEFAAEVAAYTVEKHDRWHLLLQQARLLVPRLRELGVLR